jgi:hypothetical protein
MKSSMQSILPELAPGCHVACSLGLPRQAPSDATIASPAQPPGCRLKRSWHEPNADAIQEGGDCRVSAALGLQQESSYCHPSLIERDPNAVGISVPHSRNQLFTRFLSRQVDNVAEVIPRDAEQPQARAFQSFPHDVILLARILVSQQNNLRSLISAQNLVECVAPSHMRPRLPQVAEKHGVGGAGRR